MAEKEAWYHHSISRKEAEEKLYHSEKDGAFLVRKSDTVPGAYVLSLHVDRFIHHYRIRLDTDGFYVTVNTRTNLNSMKFESLVAVIKYLMQNPNKINLAGPLLFPISPEKEEEDFYETEDEDEDDMSSDDEQDETIRKCPAELRLTLKKRTSTHHSGNKTMRIFQDVFNSLDTTELEEADPGFVALLRRYVQTSAFWDIQKDDSGGTGCLERLVDYSCRDLLTQLQLFNQKMAFLDKLVSGIAKGSLLETSLREEAPAVKEELLDSIDPALVECSRVSTRIGSKINNVFKHLSRSIQVSEECLINDTKTFEAKEEGLRGGKIHLAVDPRRGTVSLGLGKSGTEYFHQQIKRLEKNYKDPNKMTIIFMDKKKREIVFDDTRTREEFFRLCPR
ncbi:phosphatidylinositol 3,4,5-trisphosphate 5-phosphatase 2B-like [Bolinopsis microptera]|uniref:phosphatidylinositol 3,4,5-trisphosphate 5-phosphatase 2B-like n=1 Tax=Bolinopsis microptera TaxID=2820187 RepID=UPI00307ADD84